MCCVFGLHPILYCSVKEGGGEGKRGVWEEKKRKKERGRCDEGWDEERTSHFLSP